MATFHISAQSTILLRGIHFYDAEHFLYLSTSQNNQTWGGAALTTCHVSGPHLSLTHSQRSSLCLLQAGPTHGSLPLQRTTESKASTPKELRGVTIQLTGEEEQRLRPIRISVLCDLSEPSSDRRREGGREGYTQGP